jgi:NADP-dependent 3-hydroxy acid dehydrogenase YdfG
VAGGIGKAVAAARRGRGVRIASRKGKTSRPRPISQPGQQVVYRLPSRKHEQIESLVRRQVAAGQVDILVNNTPHQRGAGRGRRHRRYVDKMIEINIKAAARQSS